MPNETGATPEYVEAMWAMLQQEQPENYVIGTGESHSVQEFLELAFAYVNLDWHDYVEIDPRYFRPSEVDYLLADPSKARAELGWQATVSFAELVKIMVDADMEVCGLPSAGQGKQILAEKFQPWHRWETSGHGLREDTGSWAAL